jgi:hypothetical protein
MDESGHSKGRSSMTDTPQEGQPTEEQRALERALELAANTGQTHLALTLLKAGAQDKDYALERAAINGHKDTVEAMLSEGARPIDDGSFATTWRMAAHGGHRDVVRVLLEWTGPVKTSAFVPKPKP